jgi:hypothetical protein
MKPTSIDLVHFTPIIGGETTLVKAMYKLLCELGYSVRIIHPSKSGKCLSGWCTFEGQNFVKISAFEEFIKETDILFFINSIHLKKFRKLEDRSKVFESIEPIYGFKDKKVIFYEHGRHSSDLYDYPTIFEKLRSQGNNIRVFTNTNDVIPYYKSMNYDAYLIRQPFDPDFYPKLENSIKERPINIAFNSRYTSSKRPQDFLPFFSKYLGKDENFNLNFRGSLGDNVTIWFNLKHYFLDPKIIMHKYAEFPHQVYENQDYCLYTGYGTKSEKGKMEYSMLEPFYYGIPLIVEKEVIQFFRYEEYGISKEDFLKSVILLNEENLDSIIKGEFNWKPYAENAKKIIDQFLPESTKSRLKIGIESFDKPSIQEKKPIPLF